MNKSQFMRLRIGEVVTLDKFVSGNYSNYGTNPVVLAQPGTELIVNSTPLPSVTREGVFFLNCKHPRWKQGFSVLPHQLRQEVKRVHSPEQLDIVKIRRPRELSEFVKLAKMRGIKRVTPEEWCEVLNRLRHLRRIARKQ